MIKLMVCLVAGVMALGCAVPVAAQQLALVDPAAIRVVIAPPATALARTIKQTLSAAYYGASKDSDAYLAAQKLYFFYGGRHFEPIWLTQAGDDRPSFSPLAQNIIALFKDANSEGLRPADYLTPGLDLLAAAGDPAKLTALETR